MWWASPGCRHLVRMAAYLCLAAALLVAPAAGAAHSTVLASVEASLETCRDRVADHRAALTSCNTMVQPVKCNCLCPTCLPQKWPHRKEPPLCTTPPPPPMPEAAKKPTTPPPPPTAPPPPPLPPLKVLPPYTGDHLPTIGPFPETAQTTTTTLFPPPPPPGKCIDDGIYRGLDGVSWGSGTYEEVGTGLCTDKGGIMIAFKKRRELTKKNFECVCKEACDMTPGCIGYSTNGNFEHKKLSCRVYGHEFPKLQDAWLDLGSLESPRYRGLMILEADGTKRNTCFRKICGAGSLCVSAPTLVQTNFIHRRISTHETLEWQREQLTRCRSNEAEITSLLRDRGCLATKGLRQRGFLRQAESIMPTNCNCNCPDCNYWQLPPPVCRDPTPAPTEPPPAKLPAGVIVATPVPRPPTPPPIPVQMPIPEMPPFGNQFLPTLGPAPYE